MTDRPATYAVSRCLNPCIILLASPSISISASAACWSFSTLSECMSALGCTFWGFKVVSEFASFLENPPSNSSEMIIVFVAGPRMSCAFIIPCITAASAIWVLVCCFSRSDVKSTHLARAAPDRRSTTLRLMLVDSITNTSPSAHTSVHSRAVGKFVVMKHTVICLPPLSEQRTGRMRCCMSSIDEQMTMMWSRTSFGISRTRCCSKERRGGGAFSAIFRSSRPRFTYARILSTKVREGSP
mmetsp:Transcript_19301/g.46625  ORF Transcript_19301/g.46625 Transcript_19301/m.46625 type:complete len:241 (+) Transcript_19301:452-1174(+)